MNKRSTFVLTVALLAVSACSESLGSPADIIVEPSFAKGGRPYLPGERQPDTGPDRGTLAIYPPGEGQILAQTFSPVSNQRLGYLELPVGCAEGVLLNVKVREGIGGTILYEANTIGLPQVVDGTFQLIQVFDPRRGPPGIKLRRGREYAFELSAFPVPEAVARTCGIAQGPVGNNYPRGRAYYQDPLNGPSFLPLPTGSPADDEDLPFITKVR